MAKNASNCKDVYRSADVSSDGMAFMGYDQTGYDLSTEIAAYDCAISEAQSSLAQTAVVPTPEEISEENLLTAANDIYYNKRSEANDTLTYTRQIPGLHRMRLPLPEPTSTGKSPGNES